MYKYLSAQGQGEAAAGHLVHVSKDEKVWECGLKGALCA